MLLGREIGTIFLHLNPLEINSTSIYIPSLVILDLTYLNDDHILVVRIKLLVALLS